MVKPTARHPKSAPSRSSPAGKLVTVPIKAARNWLVEEEVESVVFDLVECAESAIRDGCRARGVPVSPTVAALDEAAKLASPRLLPSSRRRSMSPGRNVVFLKPSPKLTKIPTPPRRNIATPPFDTHGMEEEDDDDGDAEAAEGVRENLRLRIEVLDLKNRLDSAEESLSTAVAGGVPSRPSLLRIAQRSSRQTIKKIRRGSVSKTLRRLVPGAVPAADKAPHGHEQHEDTLANDPVIGPACLIM